MPFFNLRFYLLFIITLISISSFNSFADSLPSPEYLYHWTSAKGLERWDHLIQQKGVFVFKPLVNKDNGESLLTSVYPELKGIDGIFAWSHLEGGMAAFAEGASEWNAREMKFNNEITPASLVVIKLLPNIPVLELNTHLNYNYIATQEPPSLIRRDENISKLDKNIKGKTRLILHRIFDQNGVIILQEYILLSRGAISTITANPRFHRKQMEEALNRLKDNKPYMPYELYTPDGNSISNNAFGHNKPHIRAVLARVLNRAMHVLENTIPSFFKDFHSTQPESTEVHTSPRATRSSENMSCLRSYL